MTELRRHFRIEGRVQGVGFRWFALNAARELGLVGWVRNEPDGSVTCEAQGSPESVQALGRLLRAGPRSARVTAVQETDLPPGRDHTFEIR